MHGHLCKPTCTDADDQLLCLTIYFCFCFLTFFDVSAMACNPLCKSSLFSSFDISFDFDAIAHRYFARQLLLGGNN